MQKKSVFGGDPVRKSGGITPTVIVSGSPNRPHISLPNTLTIFASIMIKKFDIIATHMSEGAMQESPSYEMGVTKYARMRQDMKNEKKINMMAEAFRKGENPGPSLGMIMPLIKK